jgi:galactose mutarotase-like enzyme
VKGATLALTPDLFADDALIFDQITSRRLRYHGENGVGLDIGFDGFDELGIWQKPGGPFLCIEPWAGLADPAGFTGELREKPGIVELAPGGERAFRMDVTVLDVTVLDVTLLDVTALDVTALDVTALAE